jgi:hypothetical protein
MTDISLMPLYQNQKSRHWLGVIDSRFWWLTFADSPTPSFWSPSTASTTFRRQGKISRFKAVEIGTRVARWFNLKRKIPIWVHFGGPWN